jgi:probable rRNA maturation factor
MAINLKNLQKKIPIPEARIIKAATHALRKIGILCHPERSEGSLSIVFVGSHRMRSINNKYLKHDYITDVLTFDLGEGQGEIIICPQVAASNAKTHQTSIENEITLYVIHGILHLAGYDDHNPKDILEMRRMETELL